MLRIVDTVLELIREVRPLAEAVGRHDRELARQLRESLDSVAANIAEGSGQIGRRRPAHYAIALGSAREALVHLRVAEAWGYIPAVPHDTRERFAKVEGTLVKVAR